jgi:hypothetical protein
MDLNVRELQVLLEALENLGGNEENWKLQEKMIKHITWKIKYIAENEGKQTGFKELDYPDMP